MSGNGKRQRFAKEFGLPVNKAIAEKPERREQFRAMSPLARKIMVNMIRKPKKQARAA